MAGGCRANLDLVLSRPRPCLVQVGWQSSSDLLGIPAVVDEGGPGLTSCSGSPWRPQASPAVVTLTPFLGLDLFLGLFQDALDGVI